MKQIGMFDEEEAELRPLRVRQANALEQARQAVKEGHKRIIIAAPCGFGKCHGKGTEIIMYDGSLRKVEDVNPGDLLMGPDSKPRRVISTVVGDGLMYRVVPSKGEPFTCNDVHVLSLKRTSYQTHAANRRKVNVLKNTIINIPLEDYLKRSHTFKSLHRLWRTAVDFPVKPVSQRQIIPPYIMGVWLGDGTSRSASITTGDKEIAEEFCAFGKRLGLRIRAQFNSKNSLQIHLSGRANGIRNEVVFELKRMGVFGNKHIPDIYRLGSRDERLELLAGIIDTDGAYIQCCYTVHQKSKKLAEDIAFVGRSVGFGVTITEVQKECVNNGKVGTYFAINISGDVGRIPCRLERKKSAKRIINKDPLVSGFSVEPIGHGQYYGFDLSGDHLYLLRDFTVTHNTLISAHLITSALEKRKRPIFTCPAVSLVDQTLKAFEGEGIHDIGVMQAQHERTDRHATTQIASVQTLVRREQPDVDFMILDECHMLFVALNQMLDGPWKDKIAIGLSATPWAKGMGLRWTKLIIPATIPQLVEEGFLSPTDLYIPDQIAVRGNMDIQKGEFTEASASKEMRQNRIVGNVVETWNKLSPREKTFMFCVNREHAREQMGAFIDSGVPFGYIDANTSMDDRTLAFEKMRLGDIAGIASVGCLIAGVDEDVRCVIDAAPTISEMRHVQKWGRGIRTADGKFALCGLDHAGNNSDEGMGLFWEIYHDKLDMHKESDKEVAYEGDPKPAKPQRCPFCHLLIPKGHAACLKCGAPLPANSGLVHEDGELALYGGTKKKVKERQYTMEERQSWYSGFLWICQERGKAEGAAAHRYREKFGVFPRGLNKSPSPPSFEVEQFDKHCRIKYVKSLEKKSKMGVG